MLKAGTAARRRTLRWDDPTEPDALYALVENLLNAINQRLVTHGPAWIGHVKIMLTANNETCYGSLTSAADTPHWAGRLTGSATSAEMTVYAAIYELSDANVAGAVDGALDALPAPHTASTG